MKLVQGEVIPQVGSLRGARFLQTIRDVSYCSVIAETRDVDEVEAHLQE